MATMAELLVEIKIRDAGVKKGLASTTTKIGKFAKDVGKKLAIITALVSAAVVAATLKMTQAISRTAKEIDKLAKTATKLGVSVAALQKLQYQAQLTGVSTETLNMALQRMVRRVAEAAKGTGEAKDALKELGIDAGALNRLSPDKQFQRIAQAMKYIGNQGDRVRLAMKLFDSEGVALVNTLASNLDKTGKSFDKLGISISASQAKAVEAFNDAQTKLGAIWEGFKMQITAAIAPAFTNMIDQISLTIEKMGGLEVVAKQVAVSIVSGVIAIVKAFEYLTKTIKGIEIAYRTVAVAAAKLNPKNIDIKKALLLQRPEKSEGEIQVGERLGKSIDELKNVGATSKLLEGMLKGLQQQQATIEKGTAATKVQGIATLTDVSTGKTLNYNQQAQKIEIKVTADKEGLVAAVVQNPDFKDQVVVQTNAATRDAARATRR